jgi:uncharacterized protein (DUF952 family)
MSNPTAPARNIYKILTPDQWATLCRNGETTGSPLDQVDGFIHFSTPAQVAGTLSKHFAGAGPLVLAEIPLPRLTAQNVRWERARNGDLFPHLYGVLAHDSVSQYWSLHPDDAGVYALPETFRTKIVGT